MEMHKIIHEDGRGCMQFEWGARNLDGEHAILYEDLIKSLMTNSFIKLQ